MSTNIDDYLFITILFYKQQKFIYSQKYFKQNE